jgi:hypothetical protein
MGHYLGVSPAVAGRTGRHTVMVGGDSYPLSSPELTVWLASRGSHTADRHTGRDRGELVRHAAWRGLPDPAPVVDRLIRRGLLVELSLYSRQTVGFGRRSRIVPLMLGLGNRPDEPARYGIGFYAEPVLPVTGLVYRMWEWSHVEASLWAGCRSHASVARRAGLAAPNECDPMLVLNRFLEALPPLLAFGAAYVDRVRRSR